MLNLEQSAFVPGYISADISVGTYGVFAQRPCLWLPCDRAFLYNSKTFPELFSIVGCTHSSPGDPESSFRLPNLSPDDNLDLSQGKVYVFAGVEIGDPIPDEINPVSIKRQILRSTAA